MAATVTWMPSDQTVELYRLLAYRVRPYEYLGFVQFTDGRWEAWPMCMAANREGHMIVCSCEEEAKSTLIAVAAIEGTLP